MKKQDFIAELEKVGWIGRHDAQHTGIEKLWRKMFPVVAGLQDEVKDLEADISEYIDAQPPI